MSRLLIEALGLPRRTISVDISLGVDHAPKLIAAFHPVDSDGNIVLNDGVLAVLHHEFVLVPRERLDSLPMHIVNMVLGRTPD